MRTVRWTGGGLDVIDQTALPELRRITLSSVDDVVDAISRLVVRGAPQLGVVGALGVALASRDGAADPAAVGAAAERIASARPTAANLRWGVRQALAALPDGPDAVLATALDILADDIRACQAMGGRGADLLAELCRPALPLAVHTHCNAGAMACVAWGTALGVVRSLHQRGALRLVVAGETRPLLQGARITAFELAELGVEHRIVVDGAGPSVIARGLVDAVVVGADRIAANGDVANKVGTYPLALAAARAGIPFLVAAPESTVDPATPDGAVITIEERAPQEVLAFGGERTAPAASKAWNPAFDVTPADLVTAIVTERRTVRPANGDRVAG